MYQLPFKVISDKTGKSHDLYYTQGPERDVTFLSDTHRKVQPGRIKYYVDGERLVNRQNDGSYIEPENGEVFREESSS